MYLLVKKNGKINYIYLYIYIKVKVKIKFTVEQGTKAQRESRGIALSLTLTLDGVGGQRHAPAALRKAKTRHPLYRGLGLVPGPFSKGAENLASTGIRSQDRPARSESLYPLPCPSPYIYIYIYILP
jgi:hypothetical protein